MIHPNPALKTASPLSCGEQNSQLSRIRNPGSIGQTLAAAADFLPAQNPISLTDFSYFPDWFAEYFHQERGLKWAKVSHRELTLWWKGHNLKIVYSTSLYHHISHAKASSHCLLLHLLLFSVFHKLTDLIIFRPFEIALRRTWKILKLWNCKHLGWVISCLHH